MVRACQNTASSSRAAAGNVVAVVCATLSGDGDELMSKNHISNLPKYVFRGEIVSSWKRS